MTSVESLLLAAEDEDGLPDVDVWIDTAICALRAQAKEIERLTEGLKIASAAVGDAQRQRERGIRVRRFAAASTLKKNSIRHD